MSGLDRRGRPVRRRAAAVSVLAGLLVLALVPSVAQAHRMSMGRATKAAKAVAIAGADQLHGSTLDDGGVVNVAEYAWGNCRRRSVHRFVCAIGAMGTINYASGAVSDFACARRISVAYGNHRSRRLRLGLVGDPVCEVTPRAAAGRARPSSARGAAAKRAVSGAFERALR